ncbi:MAG: protein translocase subunit SecD [Planctomycetota bacterium]|nr:MAG: protein translocase subunit SecD [Planctomycetota bacterium]
MHIISRFTVIFLALASVLTLMAIKNKVLVGEQEFFALLRVEAVDGVVPAGPVEVSLNDLGGREVNATENELQRLRSLLTREADPNLPRVHFDPDSLTINPVTQRMNFALTRDASLVDLRQVVVAHPYRRRNEPLPLWYAPLGIDLRGGVEFRLALYDDDGARVAADEDTVVILRNRLDARGLSEPQVSRLSNGDVQVVIPGGTQADAARTRRVLQTAGRLEFREVLAVFGDGGPREPGHKVIEVEPGVYRLSETEYMGFTDVLYPAKPPFRGERPRRFYRLAPPGLTGQDVSTAYPTTQDGRRAVGMTFTTAGAAKNNRFTTSIHSRGEFGNGTGTGRMAISLDGVVESSPVIINPSSVSSVVTGNFTQDEIENLVTVLKAGSLAVTPQVLAERVVGASLGAETVTKATWSMISAMILVLLVMGFYYQRMGIVAVTSLVCATGLVFGVLVVFGATLTLPGIAGLVLTVGMAVDANILIFERIREELKNDSDLPSSIEAGYGRALSAIIDANVTTFLTALILYVIGTGPIQGFGLTLMIGIATSMFSAVYVGRTITLLLYRKRQSAHVPDYVGEINLPYVRWRFAAFGLSGLMIIAGFLEFFVWTNPDQNFDIDFTGGNMIQVTFVEEMDQAAVTAGLQRAADAGLQHLYPGAVQMQPYFQGFGAGGGSRQWMFKARDDEASVLERELSDLETEVARLLRRSNSLRTQSEPDEAAAVRIDRERQELMPRVRELQDRIAGQTDILAAQLRDQAFPGLIAEPGSQIRSLEMVENTLRFEVGIIDPAPSDALVRIGEALLAEPQIREAEAQAGENAILMTLRFNQLPGVSADFDLDEPAAHRVRALLAEAGFEGDRLNGHAIAAFRAYSQFNVAAAAERIRTERPFPSQEHFSGLVASQMKIQAALALAVALLGILLYVAARFEFRYGVGAVTALFHDIPITIGLLVFLGVRIDLTVVAALLTIIGYSLNDTIVVFDRIREVRKLNPELTMAQVIDKAIAQTMSRTVMTTLTTLSVVVILFVFGGDGVRAFSLTLIIGLILGTYSSIFIASPVLLFLDRPAKPGETPEGEDEMPVYGPGAELEPR